MSSSSDQVPPSPNASSQGDEWEMVSSGHGDHPAADASAMADAPSDPGSVAEQISSAMDDAAQVEADVAAQIEAAASKLAAAAKPAPAAAAATPNAQQPAARHLFDLDGFRRALPPAVDRLLFFENPTKSAIALAVVLAVYALLFIDFGYSHLFLVSFVCKWFLAVCLAVAGVSAALRRFKPDQAVDLLEKHLGPYVSQVSAKSKAVSPGQFGPVFEPAVAQLPKLVCVIRDIVLVRSFAASAKALVVLQAVQLLGQWFSGPSLILIALLGAIAFPISYLKLREPIDKAFSVVCARYEELCSKLCRKNKAE